MSVSCKNEVLTFSDFGIELEPLAWSAEISGESIDSLRVVTFMHDPKDGIRAEEKRMKGGMRCIETGQTNAGETVVFKQDPLTVVLFFLKICMYQFPP